MCSKAWVQGLSFTLICEGGCKGGGGPAPAGWLDAAGAVEAGVEPPAYPHGANFFFQSLVVMILHSQLMLPGHDLALLFYMLCSLM